MPETEKEKFEKFLKINNFDEARKILVTKITANDLDWKSVKLDNSHSVQVCLPVRVKGPDDRIYYVPVTPSETWNFAKLFNALPLTSLVFDQYHNQGTYIQRSGNHDASNKTGKHFHTFSEYLNQQNYHLGIKSGAHKLWILSTGGRSINRGFYFPKPKDPVKYKAKKVDGGLEGPGGPGGPKLSPAYWLIQVRGPAHNSGHWDYSQLLQLMKSDDLFGVTVDFKDSLFKLPYGTVPSLKLVRLREAVIEGLPEVWDEPKKISPDILP